jgi:hypothetical protein
MTEMIHLIATLVALAGLLAALGNGAYLLMLDNVAKKRPGGQITRGYVKKQLPLAGGATAGAAFALLLTSGGVPPDIIATLLGDVVRTARSNDRGELTITFASGAELLVGIDADVESWAVTGPDGLLIVCLAQGELAVWGDPGA